MGASAELSELYGAEERVVFTPSLREDSPLVVQSPDTTLAAVATSFIRDATTAPTHNCLASCGLRREKTGEKSMYEPCILKKELQYSCDLCGELPIAGKRWCCNVCEDFGESTRRGVPQRDAQFCAFQFLFQQPQKKRSTPTGFFFFSCHILHH